MTFKECRKYGREQINSTNKRYGFMYKDKKGNYTFSFEYYFNPRPVYVLEKNGVVDKVMKDGSWKWDYEKRGMHPKNKKGWNRRKTNADK